MRDLLPRDQNKLEFNYRERPELIELGRFAGIRVRKVHCPMFVQTNRDDYNSNKCEGKKFGVKRDTLGRAGVVA